MSDGRARPAPPRGALDRIFDPRSIAIVGASAEPAKRGYQILRALERSGYRGKVFAVNPRGGEILGRQVHESLAAIPATPDLAVLCTPAATAPDLVRACGQRGIAGAVVLAVGFGESGPEGRALEERLAVAGRESGVRIVGPNTSGMLNLSRGVNLVGADGVRAGSLALVVQSGNVALALMNEVTEHSCDGISVYVGVGNELDVGFRDTLDFLEHHEETRAIIVYAEGIRDPRGLLVSAARITRMKPIVTIKSGRTREGAAAAASHTGSVAGPYDRLRAGMAQAGIVEVTRTDELLHVAETLGHQPALEAGTGIAILSDGGGQGTLAADTLIEAGVKLASLAPTTRRSLRTLLGTAAAVANPVDLAGSADTDPTIFALALDAIARDPQVGAVLLVGLFGGYGVRFATSLAPAEVDTATSMIDLMSGHGKGLVVHSMYAGHGTQPVRVLREAGVPVIASLEVACRCVAELERRGAYLRTETWELAEEVDRAGEAAGRTSPGSSAIGEVRSQGRRTLTEPEARALLGAYGLTSLPGHVAESATATAAAVRDVAAPCAVKLVSKSISHKSDAGGIVLDVRSDDDALRAFESIAASTAAYARSHDLAPEPTRVLVTPMLPVPRVELLVGAYRDLHLGPILTLGAGGIWVEALGDVALRMLPVTDTELAAMLTELRVARLLEPGRGRTGVSPGPILATARAIARCISSESHVAEVEINPLFVYEDRCVPVDARVILTEE